MSLKTGDLVTFTSSTESVWVDPDPFDDDGSDLMMFEWKRDEPAVVVYLAEPDRDFRWVKLFILTRTGWYFEEDLNVIE